MKKILILASNSFTGSHLANHCLRNNYKVIGVSRSEEYSPVMLPYLYKREEDNNFSFHQLNVNTQANQILELCDEEEPELIANFAAQGEVRNSWLYPEQWYETNTMAVIRLTEELRKRDYLKQYLTASTPEVYGSTSENLEENHKYSPSTPYAASKLAGDLHLVTLYKRYGFPVVFTRSANVYGIHQQLYRIIPRTIIFLKLGKKIELHGGGKALRSFIHIRDVVDATLKVAENGIKGDFYHVSPQDDEVSIYSVVEMISRMMGYDFESSVELIEQNYGQDTKYSISSSKIRSELDWLPNISLEDGIDEMILWIEENWQEISKMPLDYVHKK